MLPYLIYLFIFLVQGKSENSIEFKIEIANSYHTISLDMVTKNHENYYYLFILL